MIILSKIIIPILIIMKIIREKHESSWIQFSKAMKSQMILYSWISLWIVTAPSSSILRHCFLHIHNPYHCQLLWFLYWIQLSINKYRNITPAIINLVYTFIDMGITFLHVIKPNCTLSLIVLFYWCLYIGHFFPCNLFSSYTSACYLSYHHQRNTHQYRSHIYNCLSTVITLNFYCFKALFIGPIWWK